MRLESNDSHGERRVPACTNCRRHKVKCVHSDPNDLTSPCLRCIKGNKDCVFDNGGRRRNKITTAPSSTSLHRVNSDASVHKDSYKYKHTGPIYGNGMPPTASSGHTRPVFSGFGAPGSGLGGSLDYHPSGFDNGDEPGVPQFTVSDSSVDSPHLKSKAANGTANFSPSSDDPSPESARSFRSFPPPPATANVDTHGGVDGLQQTISSRNIGTNVPPQQQVLPHQSLFVDAIPMDQFRTYRMANPVNVIAIRDQMLEAWQKLTDRDNKRLRSYDVMDPKFLSEPTDRTIVEMGLITIEEAQHRLECYRNFIYPFVPIISIGDADVNQLIAERPLIFNTIMDVTSRYIKDPKAIDVSMRIHNVAYVSLVKEVYVYSNKTLEGFLALLLQIYFYNEPEFYHRTRVYALTATATSMAFDLGLGVAPLVNNGGSHELPRYEQIVTPHILVDSTNEVCYRAWIAAYSAMFNVLVSLRRPNQDLWNNYTRDAIGFLLRSGDPRSILVAKHAEFVHLHFEITERLFRKDNDSDVPCLTSPGTAYLITQFDQEIERLRQIEPRVDSKSDMFMYLSTRAFLHQGVLYSNYSKQFGRTPFTNYSLNAFAGELTPEAARSFKICYEAAVGAVRTLIELPRDKFLFLPTPMLSQLVFNAGLILKCRALVMINKSYNAVIGVPTDFIDDVSDAAAALDAICEAYPFSNMTLCLSFVIKLLMCHNDAVIHHMVTRYAYSSDIVVPPSEESPAEDPLASLDLMDPAEPPVLSKDESELPPLAPAPRGDAPSFLVVPDEDLVSQNRRASAISLEGETLLRNTHLFPAEMDFEGEHPFWQMSEDFWKGVFPADGAMSLDL